MLSAFVNLLAPPFKCCMSALLAHALDDLSHGLFCFRFHPHVLVYGIVPTLV
jgi:hypothetical protein